MGTNHYFFYKMFASRRIQNKRRLVRFISSLKIETNAGKSNTLAKTLSPQFEKFDFRDCIIAPWQNIRFSYGEVAKHTDAFAHGFHDIKIKKQDNVGVFLRNETEPLIMTLALTKIGAKLLYGQPSDVKSLDSHIKNNNLKTFIFPPVHNRFDYIEFVEQEIPEYQILPYGATLKSKKYPNLKYVIQTGLERQRAMYSLRAVHVYHPMPSAVPQRSAEVEASDKALTTTSTKKSFTQAELVSAYQSIAKGGNLSRDDRILLATNGGEIETLLIALGTWENGGCVVIPKTPEEAVKFQKEHAATALVVNASDLAASIGDNFSQTLKKIFVLGDVSGVKSSIDALEGKGIKVYQLSF